MVSCLVLFMQLIPCALSLARLNVGSNKAAKIAIIAITTSSSIRVKPGRLIRWKIFIFRKMIGITQHFLKD